MFHKFYFIIHVHLLDMSRVQDIHIKISYFYVTLLILVHVHNYILHVHMHIFKIQVTHHVHDIILTIKNNFHNMLQIKYTINIYNSNLKEIRRIKISKNK